MSLEKVPYLQLCLNQSYASSRKVNGKNLIESEKNSVSQIVPGDKDYTGFRILVVEDDAISRNLLQLSLRNLYKLDFAENGETAVQMAMDKRFDAILMDINLGTGIGGLEAVQKIKNIESYKDVPIIAVTAYAMERDKERFLNNGCSYYILKPFERKTILEVLNSALKADVSK